MVLSNPELVYDVKCTGQMSLICTFQAKVIVVSDARKTHLRGSKLNIFLGEGRTQPGAPNNSILDVYIWAFTYTKNAGFK